uniref:Ig-like domain-containing protein n=1 Tax=Megaselia scalaris TaxID=36166 RepID=T1GUF2_MEGSC
TSSTVTYTPITELDYGTLLCIATNKIGRQKTPCVFHIIAAVQGGLATRDSSDCVWRNTNVLSVLLQDNFEYQLRNPEETNFMY